MAKGHAEDKMKAQRPTNKQELKVAAVKAWQSITDIRQSLNAKMIKKSSYI